MRKPKEFWILKTPGDTFVEIDEPIDMDWSVCKKIHVVEYSAYEKLREELEKKGCTWHKEKIGELTKDFATLQQKAQENEARWQAVCADLEAKLEVAVEALEYEIDCRKNYKAQDLNALDKALQKIKELTK